MKAWKKHIAITLAMVLLLSWSVVFAAEGDTEPEAPGAEAAETIEQPGQDEAETTPARSPEPEGDIIIITLAPQEEQPEKLQLLQEGETEPVTVAAKGLTIDNKTIYQGMEKSYSQGYVPTVAKNKATVVLPLLGDTQGQVIHVRPELSADGPYVYGNYEFDVSKTTEQALDGSSHSVFLVRMDLPLKKTRYNDTYSIPFFITYTDTNGEERFETYEVVLTITDGKKKSTGGGGGGGPAIVKKPTILITDGNVSATEITGGESFTISLSMCNVGDRDATNVRVQVLPEDGGIELAGSLNGTYIGPLAMEETADAVFTLNALKKAEAGSHIIMAEITYGDQYGGEYTEKGTFRVQVHQPAHIGFDEVRTQQELIAGTNFVQPFCVYNTGYATVYNVKCSLECDGLISSSAYLGNLEPQQSAEKTVTVYVTTLASRERYGATYGEAVFSYEDEEGTQYVETSVVHVVIKAPELKTDEEKKAEEEKIVQQEVVSQWWISLLLGIAAIAVLISIIVVGKLTRALKMK